MIYQRLKTLADFFHTKQKSGRNLMKKSQLLSLNNPPRGLYQLSGGLLGGSSWGMTGDDPPVVLNTETCWDAPVTMESEG